MLSLSVPAFLPPFSSRVSLPFVLPCICYCASILAFFGLVFEFQERVLQLITVNSPSQETTSLSSA